MLPSRALCLAGPQVAAPHCDPLSDPHSSVCVQADHGIIRGKHSVGWVTPPKGGWCRSTYNRGAFRRATLTAVIAAFKCCVSARQDCIDILPCLTRDDNLPRPLRRRLLPLGVRLGPDRQRQPEPIPSVQVLRLVSRASPPEVPRGVSDPACIGNVVLLRPHTTAARASAGPHTAWPTSSIVVMRRQLLQRPALDSAPAASRASCGASFSAIKKGVRQHSREPAATLFAMPAQCHGVCGAQRSPQRRAAVPDLVSR